LLGVEPAVEVHSSPLAARVEQGSYLDDPDAAEVLIGAQLAAQLELTPGKKLVLATNDVHGDLVEELARVKGVFRLGAEEFDGFFVQVPIGFARRLYDLGPDQATQLGVLLRDADDQPAMQPRLAQWVDPRQVVVRGWDEVMPELASYIRVDGGSNYVLQVILLVLIFFTIFNTLLMSVLERRREFAVLLALGTPPARLRLQILAESALIGLLGCLVGLSLGAAVAGVRLCFLAPRDVSRSSSLSTFVSFSTSIFMRHSLIASAPMPATKSDPYFSRASMYFSSEISSQNS